MIVRVVVGSWSLVVWCAGFCTQSNANAQRYIWAQSLKRPPHGSTPGQDQQALIQDKHGLFADLANKELSDSSKKFRFASKPYKDVKFTLSIQSELTLILASSYKI